MTMPSHHWLAYLRTLIALTLIVVAATATLVWLAQHFGGWIFFIPLAIVYLPAIILLPFLLRRRRL